MADKILVAGGAGYIGSVVVEQLLARGYLVVVLDDLSRGHRAAVDSGVDFVRGGIGDRAVLDEVFARHEIAALVHLAAFALVAESVAQPQKYFANNVVAGRVMLEAAARAGLRRLIFSSSCAVYGTPSRVPIPEDAARAPVNPYGQTKLEFERMLAEHADRYGLVSISLRYFNAAGATRYGEHHEPETHLIPNVLRVALGRHPAVEVYGTDYPTRDGTAVRDYVHVADIADAHVRALEVDVTGAETLNLGTGAGYSVLEVVEAARRVTGRTIPTVACPRRPGDPPELVAEVGRAGRLLGWQPQRSGLEEILVSAWRWHQTHPSGYPA
jgi:UDP-glucose 4-epimerase